MIENSQLISLDATDSLSGCQQLGRCGFERNLLSLTFDEYEIRTFRPSAQAVASGAEIRALSLRARPSLRVARRGRALIGLRLDLVVDDCQSSSQVRFLGAELPAE